MIFREIGTSEPLFEEILPGSGTVSVNWRKPLRIDEVARMAPTPEVRQRPGRG